MNHALLKTLLLFAVICISGCAALDKGIDISPRRYTDVYLKNEVKMPATPPRIIPGQVATVYFAFDENWDYSTTLAENTAESWRQTGLFKLISATKTRVPPAQGVHIQVHCNGNVSEFKDGGVGNMAFLMTAGAIPHSKGRDEYRCETQVFQNGSVILKSRTEWDFLWFDGGWGGAITLSQPEVLAKGYKNAAQHIVTRDLVALKKAYP